MANIQSFKGLNPSKRSFFSWRDRSAPAGGWQVFICRRFSLSGSKAPAGGCRTVVCRRLSLSGSNAPAGGWQVFICRRFSLSGSNAPAGGCRTVVCRRLSLAPRWRLVFVDETCLRPKSSTPEACFCRWTSPGTQAIHAGGLFLWMALA